MIVATSVVSVLGSVVAVAASVAFLLRMYDYRTDPMARPLLGIALALLVGSVLHLAIVDLVPVREVLGLQRRPTDILGGPWILIAFDLPAVVSGLWFLFALQYTGRDRQTSPIAFTAVGVLLLLLVTPNVILAALGPVAGVPSSVLNTLLGISIVLGESLALIGVFLIIATTLRHKAFPTGQTALLVLAVGAVLTVPFVATTLQSPAVTPIGVATSALCFTGAISRYRIFETLPVASVVGRDRVLDEMAEGVVLVGSDGRVRDLNPEAASLFDVDHTAAVGEPLSTVVPPLPDPSVLTTSGSSGVRTRSDRVVSVTADPVTDDRGRTLGHLLICRDVTRQRQREHRLGILTQTLAGATQQELGDIEATAAGIVDGDRRPTAGGDRIHESATDVATLVARVRDIERALANRADDDTISADVSTVLSELESTTAVVFDGEQPGRSLPVPGEPALLSAVLDTLVTGAAGTDEAVTVRVNETDTTVVVTLAPFAPGDGGSLAGHSLRIARLATEHTEWHVHLVDDSTAPRVRLRLPLVDEYARFDSRGGEGA